MPGMEGEKKYSKSGKTTKEVAVGNVFKTQEFSI